MNTPSAAHRGFAVVGAALLLFAGPGAVSAGLMEKFLHRDVDVITVTDVTDDGKILPAATPDKPIRYQLIYVGEISFNSRWGGESIPPKQDIIQWLMASLKAQGYLPADKEHPAEQVLVYGWGLNPGGFSWSVVGFLGGDKANLIWGKYHFSSMADPQLSHPNMIPTNLGVKIMEFAEDSLFVGIVRSFSMESLNGTKVTQLWETRFGCPARGLGLDDTMPLLIKAAALNFGRETIRPVALNASDAFGGSVTLGEFKVLGEYKTLDDDDLTDKARDLAVQMTKARL